MVLRYVIGAITLITLMLALPMDITVPPGFPAASLSVRVPGMAGAGGMDGADTVIAAGMDTAVDTAIAAMTVIAADIAIVAAMTDTVAVTGADIAEAMPAVTTDSMEARGAQ
jgi:hypothetical protein